MSDQPQHAAEDIHSMALFARYNPAPVFRFDRNGNILQSNPAADIIIKKFSPDKRNAFEIVQNIDVKRIDSCIADGEILSLIETVDDITYRFELKGIPELKVMQVYGADISEIVNAKYENELLSTAVHQSSNSVMITNTDGTIEFVNEAFERISGYTKEDVLGKNPKILKTNYLSKETYQKLWQTISSGEVWKGEFHNRRKNKTTYWEEATISPVKDQQGIIRNYIAVKEDITERKKAAEKFRSMALFAELNPEPVIRFADNGLILQSNPAANNIFMEETIVGFEIQDYVKEIANINLVEFIQENMVQTIDANIGDKAFRFILKGINEFNICQMYGSDITERIKAQREAESMALFAKLNPEPVFRFDKKGKILQSNPAANEIFNQDTITGLYVTDLIPELSEINFQDFIKNNELLKVTSHIEHKILRFILRGLNHLKVCQIYGSDITERVKAQEKVESQKKSITDSIQYASKIQNAILPSIDSLQKYTKDHFIFFKPRDIVSGDFYWMTEKNNKLVLVAADCTGHGVPGAFMSMLGISFLNEIVNKQECNKASTILNDLRALVKSTLSLSGKSTDDGMDLSLIIIDKENKALNFAGAYNNLYLIRGNELDVIKGDRMPIGNHRKDHVPFTNHEVPILDDDVIYLMSDGYADQFGHENQNKFSIKHLRKVLTDIHQKSMNDQKDILESTLGSWMGDYRQIDDILLIGIKI